MNDQLKYLGTGHLLWGGRLQKGGGTSEVSPQQKGGAEKVEAMLKGGTQSFEVVLTWELEVLAIVIGGGGAKSSDPLKGRHKMFYPVLRGVRKKFWTRDFLPYELTSYQSTHQ